MIFDTRSDTGVLWLLLLLLLWWWYLRQRVVHLEKTFRIGIQFRCTMTVETAVQRLYTSEI